MILSTRGRRAQSARALVADSADTLDNARRAIGVVNTILIGNDLQVVSSGKFQQLARLEQKIRVAGATKRFVTNSEGFIDQHATVAEACDYGVENGPVEVIGHDDACKQARSQGPARPVFEVGDKQFEPWGVRSARRQAAEVAVNGEHRMAETSQQACVPSTTSGKVKHGAIRHN